MADSRLLNTGTYKEMKSFPNYKYRDPWPCGTLWLDNTRERNEIFSSGNGKIGMPTSNKWKDKSKGEWDSFYGASGNGMTTEKLQYFVLCSGMSWFCVTLVFGFWCYNDFLMRRVFWFLGVEWACGNPCFWSRRLIEWLCDKWVYSCRKLQANLPQKHQSEQKINRLTHCLKTKPISILFFQVTITNIPQTNTSAMFQAKQVN